MNITSVATSHHGATQPAIASWGIVSAVQLGPVRFFRQVMYLSFPVGDMTDRIASGAANRSGHVLHLHRLDGNVPAEKPTASAAVTNRGAVFSQNFTDVRFGIRLEGPDAPLSPNGVAQLFVKSFPTGPRIGIADPVKLASTDLEDQQSAVFFWQVPGELGTGTTPGEGGAVDEGASLAAELQRYLDDSGPSPPQGDVALVVESDAPCRLNITSLNIAYHFVRETYFSPTKQQALPDKQILRFPRDRHLTSEVVVQLPGNANVTSATLKVLESFRGDRPRENHDGDGSATTSEPGTHGVYVGADRCVAQAVVPTEALSLCGVALHLTALVHDTQLLVEIREDLGGVPSGRLLAEGTVLLEYAGRQAWWAVRFSDLIVLPTTAHWILVRAAAGDAVWLTSHAETDVPLLESSQPSGALDDFRTHHELRAHYRLMSRVPSPQGPSPPLTVEVGDHVLDGPVGVGGARHLDLTTPINDVLATTAVDGMTTIPIRFTSGTEGIATVHPPRIEYDV